MAPPVPDPAARSSAGLRLRLLLLVILAVLPALGLMAISAVSNRDTLAGQVEDNALRLARLIAAGHETAIEGARQFMTALSRAPEIRSGDPRRCEPFVRDLLARFPNYLNLGLARVPDGDVLCSAVPSGAPVNVADRAYFSRAIVTGGFAVGDFIIGRITGEPSIAFGIPVLADDDRPAGVAFAALSLHVFSDIATGARLPANSSVVVVDGAGTILARVPDPQGLVGEQLPEAELVRAVLDTPQGVTQIAGLDGVRRLYGFTRLQGGEVSVAVGISSKTAFADVDRTFWIGIGGLAVVGALALAAAWYFGTVFVVRPIGVALRREREAVERLEAVDRMRAGFVSMVSHELRNPLATIRGFGQILRDRRDTLEPEQRDQAAEVIVRQADRMAALVDNVLDVSRIESDTFSYAFVSYDPPRLLREAGQEAAASWPRHRIVVDVDGSPGRATGDADRIKQVLSNLLSNACRYSAEGSTVTVRGSSDDAGGLRVDVSDEGPGIAADDAELLFQRFVRLGAGSSGKVRGTGLGLYISRRIVEAHDGRIWVESEPGRGSTFSIHLPLDPPQPG